MKKLFMIFLFLTVLGSVTACTPANDVCQESNSHAYFDDSETEPEETLTELTVNGKPVDTSKLPTAFYKEGETVMVPALTVCENLGYVCEWDSKTDTLTIEDSVQKAVLKKESRDVEVIGKLKVIDLSGTIPFDTPVAIIDGVVFVPADLFNIFFNEVVITNDTVSISATVYYLDAPGMNITAD